MTTLQDRLRLAMAGPPRVSQAALAKACGVKPPSVSDWLSGKTKRLEGANLLAAARLLRVSPEWLATGKGAMQIADATESRYRIEEASSESAALPIEFSDALGSCGGGTMPHEASYRSPLLKEPSWFKRYGVAPESVLAVWADGDSMANFIVDGDIVIFDKTKTTPRSGQIFLIEHPDGLRIKRLRREIDGAWVLESDNPDKRRYPDERVTAEQAELLRLKGQFVYRQGG